MKQLLIAMLSILLSCAGKRTEQNSISISAIVDITDPQEVRPDAHNILTLMGLGNDKGKEVFFRLLPGTDKVLNPAVTLHLPDEKTTDRENKQDIPMYRQRVIKKFYSDVRKEVKGFNTEYSQSTVMPHSECFATIGRELTLMKKNNTRENILLVYSDLAENSSIFNVYTPKGEAQLAGNTDTVTDVFEKAKLLPDTLTGFKVIVRYNPKTRADDTRFQKMVRVYSKLMEKRGAAFSAEANN